jgi:hypothetical protein
MITPEIPSHTSHSRITTDTALHIAIHVSILAVPQEDNCSQSQYQRHDDSKLSTVGQPYQIKVLHCHLREAASANHHSSWTTIWRLDIIYPFYASTSWTRDTGTTSPLPVLPCHRPRPQTL